MSGTTRIKIIDKMIIQVHLSNAKLDNSLHMLNNLTKTYIVFAKARSFVTAIRHEKFCQRLLILLKYISTTAKSTNTTIPAMMYLISTNIVLANF